MGMMPADRELNWQRVFRRFGLPGDTPEKEPAAKDQDQASKRGPQAVEREKQAGKNSNR